MNRKTRRNMNTNKEALDVLVKKLTKKTRAISTHIGGEVLYNQEHLIIWGESRTLADGTEQQRRLLSILAGTSVTRYGTKWHGDKELTKLIESWVSTYKAMLVVAEEQNKKEVN